MVLSSQSADYPMKNEYGDNANMFISSLAVMITSSVALCVGILCCIVGGFIGWMWDGAYKSHL